MYEHNYCLKLNLRAIPGARLMRVSDGITVQECICIPTSGLVKGEKKGGYWLTGTCVYRTRNDGSFSHFIKLYRTPDELNEMTREERLAIPFLGVLRDTTLNLEEKKIIDNMKRNGNEECKQIRRAKESFIKKTTMIDYGDND